MNSDTAYLKHILDAISRIEEYIQDNGYDEFIDTPLVQDGAIRQIEIIGEATKRLSDDLKDGHSDIPWKDIAGMRDRLIHDYMGVDLDAVWDTIKKDIPDLKKKIERIIKQLHTKVWSMRNFAKRNLLRQFCQKAKLLM